MTCMCGDSQCPSCGLAQGTLERCEAGDCRDEPVEDVGEFLLCRKHAEAWWQDREERYLTDVERTYL